MIRTRALRDIFPGPGRGLGRLLLALLLLPGGLQALACGSHAGSAADTNTGANTDANASTGPGDAAALPDEDAGPTDASGVTGEMLSLVSTLPATATAGTVLSVELELTLDGATVAGASVTAEVTAGGGAAEAAVTDAAGRATVQWTLGVVPVDQRLVLAAPGSGDGSATLSLEVRAQRDAPLASEPFGDVAGFLAAAGIDASTEDLVFAGDRVVLGAPGGLLQVMPDAEVSWIPLTGQAVERGWGIAVDPEGSLWLVDAGDQVLLKVSVSAEGGGDVELVLDSDGEQPFKGLNDVEVGPDGKVYATDPCLGRIIRYDPAAGAIDAVHDFDLETEGGPNGMAWDAQGRLHVTTENTLILCPTSPVEAFDEPLAGIYRMAPDEAGFGTHEAIAAGVGTFGDGATFDADGNLYAIFDTVDGLALGQSAVVVLPGGEAPPEVLVVAEDVVYANLAFGHGAFGETTLYLALLYVPVFTPDTSRGLQRVDLGVRGAP